MGSKGTGLVWGVEIFSQFAIFCINNDRHLVVYDHFANCVCLSLFSFFFFFRVYDHFANCVSLSLFFFSFFPRSFGPYNGFSCASFTSYCDANVLPIIPVLFPNLQGLIISLFKLLVAATLALIGIYHE